MWDTPCHHHWRSSGTVTWISEEFWPSFEVPRNSIAKSLPHDHLFETYVHDLKQYHWTVESSMIISTRAWDDTSLKSSQQHARPRLCLGQEMPSHHGDWSQATCWRVAWRSSEMVWPKKGVFITVSGNFLFANLFLTNIVMDFGATLFPEFQDKPDLALPWKVFSGTREGSFHSVQFIAQPFVALCVDKDFGVLKFKSQSHFVLLRQWTPLLSFSFEGMGVSENGVYLDIPT